MRRGSPVLRPVVVMSMRWPRAREWRIWSFMWGSGLLVGPNLRRSLAHCKSIDWFGRPRRVRPGQPFRVEPTRTVDRRQSQLARPRVREPVRLARRTDDDMAAVDDQRLVADLEGRLPGFDDEHLGIG